MSTFSKIIDDRFTVYDNLYGSVTGHTVGRLFTKSHSGSNQSVGSPLYPHDYVSTVDDTCTAYYVRRSKNLPTYKNVVTLSTSMQLVRSWTSNDDIYLYGRLADAFDDGTFNLPVFAGELGETADMLADRARQLARAGLAVKRGNLGTAAAILRAGSRQGGGKGRNPTGTARDGFGPLEGQRLSDAWLELQYGWKPVINDVYDLSDAIQKRDTPRRKRIRVSHSIPMVPSGSTSTTAIFLPVGGGSYSKQIIAYVEELAPTIPERLGLYNPAAIAWELLPFSFVADWFIPIGDYLKVRTLPSRCKGVFVFTTRTKGRARWRRSNVPVNLPIYLENGDSPSILGWHVKCDVSRNVYTSLPQVRLPVFRNPLGRGNVLANAVALVASVFGSPKKR